jgi:hypothetical protein
MEVSHDFQEFLDENPTVASGLASVGNLLVNALMQSKYGPVVQDLMNPGAKAGAKPAGGATANAASKAAVKRAAAGPAGKKPKASGRTTKKTVKAAKKARK